MREAADDFADREGLLREKDNPGMVPVFGEPTRVQRGKVADVVRHHYEAGVRGVLELRVVRSAGETGFVGSQHFHAVLSQGAPQARRTGSLRPRSSG